MGIYFHVGLARLPIKYNFPFRIAFLISSFDSPLNGGLLESKTNIMTAILHISHFLSYIPVMMFSGGV